MFLSRVIARADLKIAAFSVIRGGGGSRKKGQRSQPEILKITLKQGDLSQNVTKFHCGKELESFYFKIIPFYSHRIRYALLVWWRRPMSLTPPSPLVATFINKKSSRTIADKSTRARCICHTSGKQDGGAAKGS